jgi:hypothetical protein
MVERLGFSAAKELTAEAQRTQRKRRMEDGGWKMEVRIIVLGLF